MCTLAPGIGSPSKCVAKTSFRSPLCGHTVELSCWARSSAVWDTFVSPVASHHDGNGARHVIPEAALTGIVQFPGRAVQDG